MACCDNESWGHSYCSSIKVERSYVAVSLFKLNFIETLCCYWERSYRSSWEFTDERVRQNLTGLVDNTKQNSTCVANKKQGGVCEVWKRNDSNAHKVYTQRGESLVQEDVS